MQTDFTLILTLQPAPASFSNTGCQKSFQALHTPKHRHADVQKTKTLPKCKPTETGKNNLPSAEEYLSLPEATANGMPLAQWGTAIKQSERKKE